MSFRTTLQDLDFTILHVPFEEDQVLVPLAEFSFQMTAVVNKTAPLSQSDEPTFSGIWSISSDTKLDELFAAENRRTIRSNLAFPTTNGGAINQLERFPLAWNRESVQSPRL